MKNDFVLFLHNVKRYGIQGAPNFFRNRYKKLKYFFALTLNAIRHPRHEHAYGVTILTRLRDRQSLSKTMRDLLFAMKHAGIPYQTYDLNETSEVPESSYAGLLTPKEEFRIFKYDCVIQMLNDNLPMFINLKRAFVVFWEYDSGIRPIYPWLDRADAIIGMSDFNVNYYRKEFPSRILVSKILYPLQIRNQKLDDTNTIREKLGLAKDDFVVFYNFGLAMARKNPEGCVKAFSKAFAGVPNTKLLLKTAYSDHYPSYLPKLQQLTEKEGISSQTIILSKYVSDQEIYDITNACDVYMSLHRGEGFGIGIAEAMSLGKPVIVTNYSAPTEYCKSDNSITIPYSFSNCLFTEQELGTYFDVKRWAEPDIDAAARKLILCKNDVAYREAIGKAGKEYIANHFSSENFKQSMTDFLKKIASIRNI